MINSLCFNDIKASVIEKLRKAATHLTYHNLRHTLNVLRQVERIALEENVPEEDRSLLKIAALYHDLGYLQGPQNHEAKGRSAFIKDAQKWNFSPEEIEKISDLIMATKMPQTPKTKLEEIICDADLDYLGRDDFYELAEGLKKEYLHFHIVKDEEEWEDQQISFLKQHHYFTDSSKQLREPIKQRHLQKLKEERNSTG